MLDAKAKCNRIKMHSLNKIGEQTTREAFLKHSCLYTIQSLPYAKVTKIHTGVFCA